MFLNKNVKFQKKPSNSRLFNSITIVLLNVLNKLVDILCANNK